jgi:hypothetical protein
MERVGRLLVPVRAPAAALAATAVLAMPAEPRRSASLVLAVWVSPWRVRCTSSPLRLLDDQGEAPRQLAFVAAFRLSASCPRADGIVVARSASS